jgi:hypothetical protein
MIKVGQIREDIYELYVITHYRIEESLYSVIYKDGDVRAWSVSSLEDDKLIAEYPTWQEAVNSKEFRGEK